MIQFYDSTTPRVIPVKDYAALYWDGIYGYDGRQAASLFAHVRRITITGNYDEAGIADYEPGNPVFDDEILLYNFVKERAAQKKFCVVYSDRVNLASAWSLVGTFNPLWWITTLDGKEWTPETLSAEIAANWNAHIRPDRIWANQNIGKVQNGGHNWDRSNLFGNW